jgi:hypothetical protein
MLLYIRGLMEDSGVHQNQSCAWEVMFQDQGLSSGAEWKCCRSKSLGSLICGFMLGPLLASGGFLPSAMQCTSGLGHSRRTRLRPQ